MLGRAVDGFMWGCIFAGGAQVLSGVLNLFWMNTKNI